MPTFLTLLNSSSAQAANVTKQNTANFASSNGEAIAARAHETTAAGIFPLEVAFVVLGCLMVTGFLLMVRESRLERQEY